MLLGVPTGSQEQLCPFSRQLRSHKLSFMCSLVTGEANSGLGVLSHPEMGPLGEHRQLVLFL